MSTWWMKYKDAFFSLSDPLHTEKVQDFGHSFSLICHHPLWCLLSSSLGHLFWDADVSDEPARNAV